LTSKEEKKSPSRRDVSRRALWNRKLSKKKRKKTGKAYSLRKKLTRTRLQTVQHGKTKYTYGVRDNERNA